MKVKTRLENVSNEGETSFDYHYCFFSRVSPGTLLVIMIIIIIIIIMMMITMHV